MDAISGRLVFMTPLALFTGKAQARP